MRRKQVKEPGPARRRRLARAGAALALATLAPYVWGQTVEAPPAPEAAPAVEGAETTAVEAVAVPADAAAPPDAAQRPDVAAQVFAERCVGCHTIGGGMLSGPDLQGMVARPRPDVEAAVVRMIKSVGPLTDEEVALLTDLLQSADASARVQREQERAVAAEAASLEPANAAIGKALFHGRRHFAKGGMACAACHRAEGRGGTLAVPLEDAFARLGQGSLMSASEKPAFPAMRAVYASRPLTKQEALHVVKYLESLPQEPVQAGANPMGWAGMLGAAGALAAIGFAYRHRPGGTVRTRLVRQAMAGARRSAGRQA